MEHNVGWTVTLILYNGDIQLKILINLFSHSSEYGVLKVPPLSFSNSRVTMECFIFTEHF